MMDARKALAMMWSLADKPERMPTFHKIVDEIGIDDAELFWTEFWHIWTSSESLFRDEFFIGDLIRYGQKLGEPSVGLEYEDREALRNMPRRFTIWRGASAFNHDGWSWTTDRNMAEWFAGRAYGSEERYVLEATVNRRDVLAYLTGRNESEIVVSPEVLTDFTVLKQWTAKDKGPALYFAVQTGMLNSPEMDEARAALVCSNVAEPQRVAMLKQAEECLPFCEWAGLGRTGYFKAVRNILSEEAVNG